MFPSLVLVIHVVACVVLILIVLLQSGKGAQLGAAFGGASQTLFGSPGAAGFLTKITTAVAVAFMITSLLLAFWSTPEKVSLISEEPAAEQTVPESGEGLPPKTPE
ncbi:MAG: preprotein translocase subunit SecG [Proteobacteria bacterium]|nr:preprotein translocase subunit SecG [Pseudomonadota bacterium]